jgi:hypothetical protein
MWCPDHPRRAPSAPNLVAASRRPESGPFCTDSLYNARQFFRLEESMPALKNDKFKDYTRYAEHCLNMVASTRDQELRCI